FVPALFLALGLAQLVFAQASGDSPQPLTPAATKASENTAKAADRSAEINRVNEPAATSDIKDPPDNDVIKLIFLVGMTSITVSWIMIPALFAWRGELAQLYRLVQQGSVIKFITVTYIVLVIVILWLIGRLADDKISTLLAAILGYILGEAGGRAAT